MDLAYNNAMGVIGILFESGEWPELKEKMNDEVVIVLNAFVAACLELEKADKAFADHSRDFFDGKWDETITPEYWIEFRRLKTEMEKATKIQGDAYDELMDLIEK